MNIDKDYTAPMSRARRIQAQALAILQRAKEAGIPNDNMRIKQSVFRNTLHDEFYKERGQNADKIAEAVYSNPDKLFQKRFFIIDGGDVLGFSRKRAGFALLFRMIACDKNGKYEQGKQLVHFLNTAFISNDIPRHKYVESLQDYDVLFIGEISLGDFKSNFEGGSYMDDLLEYRHSHNLPTIISFTKNVFEIEGGQEGAVDTVCGRYLQQLINSDVHAYKARMQNDLKVARIRVK